MNHELQYFLEQAEENGLEYAAIHSNDWEALNDSEPDLLLLIKEFREAYERLERKAVALGGGS